MGWLRLMSNVYSFFKLSSARKSLLIKSLIMIIFIRVSLSLFSFSNVKNISKKFSKPNKNQKNKIIIEEIVWSLRVASIYVPKATCLIQAITAQILLSRYNYLSKLKIGVIKGQEFEAHAWVEINDRIVLGESEEKYIPILESES